MFTDNGCNLYTCGEGGGDGSEAEAVNRPLGGRGMAPLHQRLQRRSCSNVSLYGAPWQRTTTCKCNLPQKWPTRPRSPGGATSGPAWLHHVLCYLHANPDVMLITQSGAAGPSGTF